MLGANTRWCVLLIWFTSAKQDCNLIEKFDQIAEKNEMKIEQDRNGRKNLFSSKNITSCVTGATSALTKCHFEQIKSSWKKSSCERKTKNWMKNQTEMARNKFRVNINGEQIEIDSTVQSENVSIYKIAHQITCKYVPHERCAINFYSDEIAQQNGNRFFCENLFSHNCVPYVCFWIQCFVHNVIIKNWRFWMWCMICIACHLSCVYDYYVL